MNDKYITSGVITTVYNCLHIYLTIHTRIHLNMYSHIQYNIILLLYICIYRIREAGGFIINHRVMGELAVSRAFGDAEFKKGIQVGTVYTFYTVYTTISNICTAYACILVGYNL